MGCRPRELKRSGLRERGLGVRCRARAAKFSEAEALFEIEDTAQEFGFPTELVYDAKATVFRFLGGRFALSRERADWPGLKAMGYFSAWGM